MKKNLLLLLFALLVLYGNIRAQEPFPFWKDVQHFKTQDSASFPVPQQILLVGSSSFTKWTDVQDYFPGYKILNRGFGGATFLDLIRYRYDVIYPYAPKQIIMYCGENDFAADENLSADEVVERFSILFNLVRSKYPNIPFAYIAMKPSPSRQHLLEKFREANKKISQILKLDKNAVFIDVFPLMFNRDGTIKKDIFLEDNLHMNSKGYTIWEKAILPYLKK